jgi:hypothetical protein
MKKNYSSLRPRKPQLLQRSTVSTSKESKSSKRPKRDSGSKRSKERKRSRKKQRLHWSGKPSVRKHKDGLKNRRSYKKRRKRQLQDSWHKPLPKRKTCLRMKFLKKNPGFNNR